VGCTLVPLWSDAVSEDPLALVKMIHNTKMKAGIAISPDTPSTAITDEIGNAVDLILVMTVYPGQ
jgi:ribulose-phosphate 3-epimerase